MFLNVFAPQVRPTDKFIDMNFSVGGVLLIIIIFFHLKETRDEEKYPVLVFIHGGAFMMGSGKSTVLKPHNMLNNDIVLVLINYRVGPFGKDFQISIMEFIHLLFKPK